jgi:hypothetical protein
MKFLIETGFYKTKEAEQDELVILDENGERFVVITTSQRGGVWINIPSNASIKLQDSGTFRIEKEKI